MLGNKFRMEEGLDLGEEGISLLIWQRLKVSGQRGQHLKRGVINERLCESIVTQTKLNYFMTTTDLLKTSEVGVFPEESVHRHTPTERRTLLATRH